jgi:Amino acid permease
VTLVVIALHPLVCFHQVGTLLFKSIFLATSPVALLIRAYSVYTTDIWLMKMGLFQWRKHASSSDQPADETISSPSASLETGKNTHIFDDPLAPVHDAFDHPIQSDRLSRSLSARQVQMIAIGGTIGTGLFLGTGKSLATGGPASMLLAYAIVGGIVFVTMLSLGEMAAFIPVAGSFCTFAGCGIRPFRD